MDRLLRFRDSVQGAGPDDDLFDFAGAVVMSAVCDDLELATIGVRRGWLAATCVGSRWLSLLRHAFHLEENARFMAYLSLSTHFSNLGRRPPAFDAFAWRREQDPAAWLERFRAGDSCGGVNPK